MKQCTAKGAHTICEILQAHADVLRDSQDIRIMSMNDDIIGLTGDGSTDAAAEDQEAIGIVLLKDGLPTNEFFELEPVDYKRGRDGESPDSQALLAAYSTAWQRRRPALQPMTNVCGVSLDGASVNSGKNKGLATLMAAICCWIVFMHGIAHIVELCAGEAYKEIPYFIDVFDVLVRSMFRR